MKKKVIINNIPSILLASSKIRKTKVCNTFTRYNIHKRFYPGPQLSNAHKLSALTKPPLKEFTALIPFDAQMAELLSQYKNAPNPRLAIYYKYLKNKPPHPLKELKTAQINDIITPSIVKALNTINNIEPKVAELEKVVSFICHQITTNQKIREEYLKELLIQLNNMPNLNDFEKVLYSLRIYFNKNYISFSNAQIFLEIRKKHDLKFTPLTYTTVNYDISSVSIKPNIQETLSTDTLPFEIKQKEALDKRKEICQLMNELFSEYENNPSKILETPEIIKWYQYIESRSNIISFDKTELTIYNKLKQLQKDYAPKVEDLLKNEKDKLKILKENSQLPFHLQQEIDKCYLPEDYLLMIKNINEALIILKKNEYLSINDLKLLSINSSATIIDEEGNFKITQEAYQSFNKNKEMLNFKYLASYPQTEHILSQIKNKKFMIVKDIPPSSSSIVSIAHLSHKTLIVRDDNLKENILVRIGILTSSKDNFTFQIDSCQPTNNDINKQHKNQMFRIPSFFIIVDETEPLYIDLETTLYFFDENVKGENIIQKLIKEYDSKKDIWSLNPYQYSYTADHAFIRKLSIIFYEKKLHQLKEDFQNLTQELDKSKNIEEFKYKIKDLEIKKLAEKQLKDFQRYYSMLPEIFQELDKSLKLLEIKIKKDEQQQQNKKNKQRINILMASRKEEHEVKSQKTAKQQKEEYIKKKKHIESVEPFSNDIIRIENHN